jgi:large subunit ribosomal protein L25
MEIAALEVKERSELGRTRVERLRTAGYVPAVLYGMKKGTASLSVAGHEFSKLVHSHHKLFALQWPNGSKEDAFLQALHWDPISDVILHADFKRIDLHNKMQTQVDLAFFGQPKGLAKNGMFETTMQHLTIECLPHDLPESIRVVINNLDVGDALYVRDLTLPPGVIVVEDSALLVCQCKLRIETPEPTAEGAAAAASPTEPELIKPERKVEEEPAE